MPAPVRFTTSDSLAAGHSRQRFKLAAIAYATSRHGVDADVEIARAGIAFLCQAALEYYEAVTGASPMSRPVDAYFQLDGEVDAPEVKRARQRLQLAGMAYATARHGIDADQGMSRAGLALLLQAGIEYYEALVVAGVKKAPVDARLQLGNGAR